jgi:hypothetical protein
MRRNLITVCAALAALSVNPSLAPAAPVLTQPTGTQLAAGTTVVGTNLGEVTLATGLGTVRCNTVKIMKGSIEINTTPLGIKITQLSIEFGGTGPQVSGREPECTSWTGGVTPTAEVSGGLPWCWEGTGASDEVKLRGGKCSEVSRGMKLAFDFTSIGTCVYNRSTAAVGTFSTDVSEQQSTVSIGEQEWSKTEGSALCPSSGKLNMAFALETSSGSTYLSS